MDAATQAETLCSRLSEELELLERQYRLAAWDAETTGDPAAFARVEEHRAAVARRLANAEEFKTAESLLKAERLTGLTRREVQRWRNRLAENQFSPALIAKLAKEETAVVQQFNSFRATVDGETVADNVIDRALHDSSDPAEVEKAWRTSKRIAEHRGPAGEAPPIADRLKELVRLRNQAAAEVGYRNAYEMALDLSELDPKWLFETLEELRAATEPLFDVWKADADAKLTAKFGVAAADLRPWHYGDRFFQSPMKLGDDEDLDAWFADKDVDALTVRTFDDLGFDVRSIVAASDLYPGDPKTSRKCQHAFCTTIVAPTDVRVLCNLVPTARWMSTNLHEFGHAIYGASLDPALPYVLRDDAHLLANESIALFMERHLLDAGWLTNVAGIPAADADRIAAGGKRRLAVKHLVFTRWVLVMCHFERDL
ncbi:MAG: hypothetical protein ACRDD1_17220, partial [Planctomycetia bacterium]